MSQLPSLRKKLLESKNPAVRFFAYLLVKAAAVIGICFLIWDSFPDSKKERVFELFSRKTEVADSVSVAKVKKDTILYNKPKPDKIKEPSKNPTQKGNSRADHKDKIKKKFVIAIFLNSNQSETDILLNGNKVVVDGNSLPTVKKITVEEGQDYLIEFDSCQRMVRAIESNVSIYPCK